MSRVPREQAVRTEVGVMPLVMKSIPAYLFNKDILAWMRNTWHVWSPTTAATVQMHTAMLIQMSALGGLQVLLSWPSTLHKLHKTFSLTSETLAAVCLSVWHAQYYVLAYLTPVPHLCAFHVFKDVFEDVSGGIVVSFDATRAIVEGDLSAYMQHLARNNNVVGSSLMRMCWVSIRAEGMAEVIIVLNMAQCQAKACKTKQT
eukprot:1158392-Pelagomonas_calceolata.AAC.3